MIALGERIGGDHRVFSAQQVDEEDLVRLIPQITEHLDVDRFGRFPGLENQDLIGDGHVVVGIGLVIRPVVEVAGVNSLDRRTGTRGIGHGHFLATDSRKADLHGHQGETGIGLEQAGEERAGNPEGVDGDADRTVVIRDNPVAAMVADARVRGVEQLHVKAFIGLIQTVLTERHGDLLGGFSRIEGQRARGRLHIVAVRIQRIRFRRVRIAPAIIRGIHEILYRDRILAGIGQRDHELRRGVLRHGVDAGAVGLQGRGRHVVTDADDRNGILVQDGDQHLRGGGGQLDAGAGVGEKDPELLMLFIGEVAQHHQADGLGSLAGAEGERT